PGSWRRGQRCLRAAGGLAGTRGPGSWAGHLVGGPAGIRGGSVRVAASLALLLVLLLAAGVVALLLVGAEVRLVGVVPHAHLVGQVGADGRALRADGCHRAQACGGGGSHCSEPPEHAARGVGESVAGGVFAGRFALGAAVLVGAGGG